ncbi:hypothetical protein KQY10_01570 [Leptospira interrogans]|uniref:DUF2335 domain-containing protein n=1 Tax=Leptospira interrogans serovar Hardjo str. Norma TaxID=1279460 RepID=A0A0M5LF42_LEPIR|nr:hypothetical protein [Leptospira interrogans]ALE39110.1 hypothetical protein G436_1922 [Leptospira interrogans serovar Hardjo str. Norma]ALO00282.1 hypothetical protein LIH_07940 [Leptospira interrogans serovar Hardjo-prajitno]MCD1164334.1 hypothetical protein [Leptospira interrogans]MCH1886157.1 hypothetical protein [Leptospira interrogans]MCH1892392.1 hypothetical protein [Leptospira interrogans]
MENESKNLEEIEYNSLIDYLTSQPGHEVATRIISLFEEIKKSTLDKNVEMAKINVGNHHKQRTYLIIQQTIVFVTIVISSICLAINDKFTPTIGILFGTLIGYFFGKKNAA